MRPGADRIEAAPAENRTRHAKKIAKIWAARPLDGPRIAWTGPRAPTTVDELAEAADRVYSATGDGRAKAAASVCRALRIGRPPKAADEARLARMSDLIENGDARNAHAAAIMVGDVDRLTALEAERLEKKFRARIVSKKGFR